MLALGCGIHISWLSWDLFVLSHPQYWQHVHIDVVNDIFPIWQWVSLWFPLCRDAYIVGVISPVATIAYVCLMTVGLVLFHRRLVYSMLIPASLFLVTPILTTALFTTL